jgi:hypothetical protein
MKPTHDLIQIATAGGGLRLSASTKPTHDLIQIAAAASNMGCHVYLTEAGKKPTHDLIKIGAAGKGCVVFEFE